MSEQVLESNKLHEREASACPKHWALTRSFGTCHLRDHGGDYVSELVRGPWQTPAVALVTDFLDTVIFMDDALNSDNREETITKHASKRECKSFFLRHFL